MLKPGGRLIIVELHKTQERNEHVRAPKEVVEKEITGAGFRKLSEPNAGMKENYIVIFRKT